MSAERIGAALDEAGFPPYERDVQNVELDPAPVLVTSAHEILETAERPCIVPGCTGTDAGKGGPYRGKCRRHCDELSERIAQGVSRTRREPVAEVSPREARALVDVPTPSIADAAKALVPHARRLEGALERRRAARVDAKAVLGEFKAAWQELKTAVDEALA